MHHVCLQQAKPALSRAGILPETFLIQAPNAVLQAWQVMLCATVCNSVLASLLAKHILAADLPQYHSASSICWAHIHTKHAEMPVIVIGCVADLFAA